MVLFLLNDWYFHVHTMPLGWKIFALRKLHEIKPLILHTGHSGFGLSDWPIWTGFGGRKLPTAHTFFW